MLWHERDQGTGSAWVEEGAPVGQFYGLGGSWTKWPDLPEITEGLGRDSPARAVSSSVRFKAYGGVFADVDVDAVAGRGGRLYPWLH